MAQPPDTDEDDGCQRWRDDGIWYRPDGPSFVGRPFGPQSFFRSVWTNKTGQRYRENGPVEARENGLVMWWKNAMLVESSAAASVSAIHEPEGQ